MSRRLLAASVAAVLVGGLAVAAPAAALDAVGPIPSPAVRDADGDLRLTWSAAPGAVGYTVEIATSPGFEAGTVLETVTTASRVHVPVKPVATDEARTLYWRVAPHTTSLTAATRGEFSDPALVSAPASPSPALLAPVPQGEDPVQITYPTPVTLRWAPVAGAATYTVQYSSDPSFPADATTTTTATTATSHTPAAPLARTAGGQPITWYWRVRADLWAGTGVASSNAGPWSLPWTFQVVWPAGVSAPVLLEPLPRTQQPLGISDVAFRWEPVPGATSYKVVVGKATDDTGRYVAEELVTAGGTTTATAFVPTVTLEDTTYKWQVIAFDAAGNPGEPSEVREFKKAWGAQDDAAVDPQRPERTYPVAHQGGTTYETAVETPLDEFELSWDPVARATFYEVEVSPQNGDARLTCRTAATSVTIIAVYQAGSTTPNALKGAGTCLWTSDPAKRIQPGGVYRWRVRAIDYSGSSAVGIQGAYPVGYLSSAYSDPEAGEASRARYVRVTAPTVDGTSWAPDEAAWTGQLSPALRGQPSPVLSWEPFGSTGYEVVIALNSDMTNQVAVIRTPSARLRLNGVFGDNVTNEPYYWRVRPFEPERPTSWLVGYYTGDYSSTAPSWQKESTASQFPATGAVTTAPDGTVLVRWTPQSATGRLDGGSRGYLVTVTNSSGVVVGTQEVEYPFFAMHKPGSATREPLTPGTYSLTVAPLDANGDAGKRSAPLAVVVGAPSPTALSSVVGTSSVSLRWSPSAATARYEVQYWPASNPQAVTTVGATSSTHVRQAGLTVPDLAPGSYGWRVVAVNSADHRSAASVDDAFTVATRNPVPTTASGAVLPTDGRVLDWAPVAGASRYVVQYATTPGGLETASQVETSATALALGATTPTNPKLEFGTTYWWRVRAVPERYYSAGASRIALGTSATTPSFQVLTIPVAPTISQLLISGDGLSLVWNPLVDKNAGAATGLQYVVRYRAKKVPEDVWTTLPPTSGDAASLLLPTLEPATTYQVEVSAQNSEGQGPWSMTREAATASAPGAPTIAVRPALNGLVVSWSRPSSTGGPGVALTGYVLRHRVDGTNAWTTVDLPATASSHTLSGLTSTTGYQVELAARNAVGVGPAAAATVTPLGLPSAPQTVKAVAGDRKVTASWTAPASTAGQTITGYELRVRAYSATTKTWGAWSTRTTTTASARTGVVTSLTNGTQYQLAVRATTGVGAGAESGPVAFKPAGKPSAPTSVKAVPYTGRTVVSWAAAKTNGSTISGYTVQYSTDKRTWRSITTVGAGSRSYSWTGGTRGKTYYFRVFAKSNLGNGAYSAVVYAKKR